MKTVATRPPGNAPHAGSALGAQVDLTKEKRLRTTLGCDCVARRRPLVPIPSPASSPAGGSVARSRGGEARDEEVVGGGQVLERRRQNAMQYWCTDATPRASPARRAYATKNCLGSREDRRGCPYKTPLRAGCSMAGGLTGEPPDKFAGVAVFFFFFFFLFFFLPDLAEPPASPEHRRHRREETLAAKKRPRRLAADRALRRPMERATEQARELDLRPRASLTPEQRRSIRLLKHVAGMTATKRSRQLTGHGVLVFFPFDLVKSGCTGPYDGLPEN